jgi:toxin ParE1/3/4
LRDLVGIRDYIASDPSRYAALVIERIINSVERLSVFPESGRTVPELDDPSIREIIVKPYRIVYRLAPGLVGDRDGVRASRLFPASRFR